MGEEQLNHTIHELGAPLSQSDGRTSCFHHRRLNFTDSLHGSVSKPKESLGR